MIKKLVLICGLALIAGGSLDCRAQLIAQTWVSGFGDNNNPCTVNAPCRTFAGAFAKTSSGGEISVMDAADFGPVTITKGITINAVGALGSVLSTSGAAITINAGASDVVVLRGLSIHGAGAGSEGIHFGSGLKLHIESTTVTGFTGDAIAFLPSGTSTLYMNSVTVRNNGASGVFIQPTPAGTASASLNNVRFEGNSRGLRVEDGSTVLVRKSIATGNSANGLVAISTASLARAIDLIIEDTTSALNGATGVYAGPFATVRLINSTVVKNGVGVSGGGSLLSSGTNSIRGNTPNNGGLPTTIEPRTD